jgi:hypothetical protein
VQIEGPTSIPAWRAALDKLQERHPLLSVFHVDQCDCSET